MSLYREPENLAGREERNELSHGKIIKDTKEQ